MKTNYYFTTLRHKKRYVTKASYRGFNDFEKTMAFYMDITCYDEANCFLWNELRKVKITDVSFDTIGKNLRAISAKLINDKRDLLKRLGRGPK